MSLRDGKLQRKDLYLTSDLYFAAYLMQRGYELLGAVDNGSPRREFGLLTTNNELLDNEGVHSQDFVLQAVEKDIASKHSEYEDLWLQIPHEEDARVNFKQFYRGIKECHRALDDALRGRP